MRCVIRTTAHTDLLVLISHVTNRLLLCLRRCGRGLLVADSCIDHSLPQPTEHAKLGSGRGRGGGAFSGGWSTDFSLLGTD